MIDKDNIASLEVVAEDANAPMIAKAISDYRQAVEYKKINAELESARLKREAEEEEKRRRELEEKKNKELEWKGRHETKIIQGDCAKENDTIPHELKGPAKAELVEASGSNARILVLSYSGASKVSTITHGAQPKQNIKPSVSAQQKKKNKPALSRQDKKEKQEQIHNKNKKKK